MKKDLAIIGGLFLLIVGLVVFGGSYSPTSFFKPPTEEGVGKDKTALSVKTLEIEVEVAANQGDRKKGLSGRDSLDINRGMLFVFEKNDIWPIWMKNMKFPIDIIWIGEDKKIVYIAQNALPEPKKKDEELFIYKPGVSAKYILEINAGLSAAHNLAVGDAVNFEL